MRHQGASPKGLRRTTKAPSVSAIRATQPQTIPGPVSQDLPSPGASSALRDHDWLVSDEEEVDIGEASQEDPCPIELPACSVVSDSLLSHDSCPPGSSIHGIFEARILEQVAISSSRRFSLTQGLNPHFSCLLRWETDSLPLCRLGSFQLRRSQNWMRTLDVLYTEHYLLNTKLRFVLQKKNKNKLRGLTDFTGSARLIRTMTGFEEET